MAINLKSVQEYFHENMPIVVIPYKYVVLPLLVLFFLFLGASIIRSPENISPIPNSSISSNPIFNFEINENFMYRNYSIRILTKRGEHKINVRESGKSITVIPVSSLPYGEEIKLEITIRKGFSFLNLWSKSFNYSYTITR